MGSLVQENCSNCSDVSFWTLLPMSAPLLDEASKLVDAGERAI